MDLVVFAEGDKRGEVLLAPDFDLTPHGADAEVIGVSRAGLFVDFSCVVAEDVGDGLGVGGFEDELEDCQNER